MALARGYSASQASRACPPPLDFDTRVSLIGGLCVHARSSVLHHAETLRQILFVTSPSNGIREIALEETANEFRLFHASLSSENLVLDERNALVMSRWAEKYSAKRLKKVSETWLIANTQPSVDLLIHAATWKLQGLQKTVQEAMIADPLVHLPSLKEHIVDGGDETLKLIWPIICQVVGVKKRELIPRRSSVLAMWSVVERTAKEAALGQYFNKLRLEMREWPEQLHTLLSASSDGPADRAAAIQAKQKLAAKVEPYVTHGLKRRRKTPGAAP